jgi:hypothetical protein
MDDVLREALVLEDPEKMLGPRRLCLEYRAGELFEGTSAAQPIEPTSDSTEPAHVERPAAALDDAGVVPV